MSFLKELWVFLRSRKKLWLLPVIIVMLVLAVLREFEGATLLKVQPSPPALPGEAAAPADATAGDAGEEGGELPYPDAPPEEE